MYSRFSQSLLCLVIAWIYLQVYFLGITSFWRRNQDDGDEKKREALKRMVQKKYEDLGSFSYAEVNVLAAFAVLILLWFFRSPGFIVGWGDLLVHGVPVEEFSCLGALRATDRFRWEYEHENRHHDDGGGVGVVHFHS